MVPFSFEVDIVLIRHHGLIIGLFTLIPFPLSFVGSTPVILGSIGFQVGGLSSDFHSLIFWIGCRSRLTIRCLWLLGFACVIGPGIAMDAAGMPYDFTFLLLTPEHQYTGLGRKACAKGKRKWTLQGNSDTVGRVKEKHLTMSFQKVHFQFHLPLEIEATCLLTPRCTPI